MGYFKNILLILGGVALLFFGVPIKIKRCDELNEQFDSFLIRHNKSYNETEYAYRLKIFEKSVELIDSFNSARQHNSSARYGLTKYSDMTPEEFGSDNVLLQTNVTTKPPLKRKRSVKHLPVKIDWRNNGIITGVNNQRLCGACWAFSTIENLESMAALKSKRLERLSVQQMIDCSVDNNGCDGGDMCVLMEWLKLNRVGVLKDDDYPLHLENGRCNNLTKAGIQIKDYSCEYLVDNEHKLLEYLATHGPVMSAVNAISWQNYLEGVIQFHCNDSPFLLNHAVQIVGYDLTAEIPHYIVRNSWGEDFGNEGYLYMAIGNNVCGIANKVAQIFV